MGRCAASLAHRGQSIRLENSKAFLTTIARKTEEPTQVESALRCSRPSPHAVRYCRSIDDPTLYRSPISYVKLNGRPLYKMKSYCAGLIVPWPKIENHRVRHCAPVMKSGENATLRC